MLIYSDVYRPLLGADNKSYLSVKEQKMIDEFHVMYMYKKSKRKPQLLTSKHLNSFEKVQERGQRTS